MFCTHEARPKLLICALRYFICFLGKILSIRFQGHKAGVAPCPCMIWRDPSGVSANRLETDQKTLLGKPPDAPRCYIPFTNSHDRVSLDLHQLGMGVTLAIVVMNDVTLGAVCSNVRATMGNYGAPTDYGVAKVVNAVTILIGSQTWLLLRNGLTKTLRSFR